MTWKEWSDMARILLNFHALWPEDQQTILLMLDGLKYRKGKSNV